jgi:hypothetical protein
MIHTILVFFFCYYYCGNFYFLSNPGMSFITKKDQFTVGIVLFLDVFTSLLYIFKEMIWIQMLFTRWFH